MIPALGVCYYPEQWSEERWAEDASEMVKVGIRWVRIGEFAWAKLEPEPGHLQFEWLDRVIAALGQAGLKIILGTPTATPPRWMLDKHPDMLALDHEGRPRRFGSRRHYCFSHTGYRRECVRIVGLLAERYGANPNVQAWQTDNEYGCHDTTRSYSDAARRGFQDWLGQRYQSPDALNRAWGNTFWSMDYQRFDQIELPNLTVTEANPAHRLAFKRFSSDAVIAFNALQVREIRKHSDAPILHNYMGRVTDFDHYKMGDDLDIATWDSYPIGFLSDRLEAGDAHKARYLRQGDPDMQAFHHDLYRTVGKGRWWVMEQQPGPVNWAPYNPAPLPGMVRLWTWEAIAHGAEVVSYFRWRQAPFAQEQMHAGLQRPDGQPAPAMQEIMDVASEIGEGQIDPAVASVALIFDYESCWAWEAQPQGADFDMFRLAMSAYRGLRRLGLSIDIVPPKCPSLAGYRLVVVPGVQVLPEATLKALAAGDNTVLFGPRTNLKTNELSIPDPMGPNLPGLDCTSYLNESLPPQAEVALMGEGRFLHWFEYVEGNFETVISTKDGQPALCRACGTYYLAGWPEDDTYRDILKGLCEKASILTETLPDGLRCRDSATQRFYFNYNAEPAEWNGSVVPAAGMVRRALD